MMQVIKEMTSSRTPRWHCWVVLSKRRWINIVFIFTWREETEGKQRGGDVCGRGASRRHHPLQAWSQQSPQSRQHGRDQLLMLEKKPHRGDGQSWTGSLFKKYSSIENDLIDERFWLQKLFRLGAQFSSGMWLLAAIDASAGALHPYTTALSGLGRLNKNF